MRASTLRSSSLFGLLVWLLVLIGVISTLSAPGMQEMITWQRWMELALEIDPVFAFRTDPNAYPPGAVSLLYLSAELFGISDKALTVKTLLLLASAGTSIATGLWLRSWPAAWLSLAVMGYVGVSLGLLDVLYLWPLTLALWALSKRRLALFSFFFATAVMIKWQPAILAPILLIYLVREVLSHTSWQLRIRMTAEILVPGIAVALITVLVFGFSYMTESLTGATQQNMWSGNALNVNWLLSALALGPVEGWGSVTYLYVEDVEGPLPVIMRWTFWIFYVALLMLVAKVRNLDFSRLIVALALAVLLYGLIAVGAHSNHMTLVFPIALFLIFGVPELRYQSTLLLAIPLVNIIWDMGLTGTRLRVPSVGPVDASIPIALFIVIVAALLGYSLLQFLFSRQSGEVAKFGNSGEPLGAESSEGPVAKRS